MDEDTFGCLFGTVIVLILVLVIGCSMFYMTPWGRGIVNGWNYTVQKVDDVTNYQTKKSVEDSCRAMISSYTADCLTYEQYKDSSSPEKQSWAEQARTRANRTAASYNEYVLKNSYVWNGNIPSDIRQSLNYL